VRSRLWPVDLAATLADGGQLGLRPLGRKDREDYVLLRAANTDWLRPWDPTSPDGIPRTVSFTSLLSEQKAAARAGSLLPFALTVDGALAGQLNVSNIVRGAFRSCTMGYWVGREFAGRGIAPLAVAVAGDYAIAAAGLHRIEINIRPENVASLAVVHKLGFRSECIRPRYLHIDGAWCDHLSFALTTEEIGPGGLRARLAGLESGRPRDAVAIRPATAEDLPWLTCQWRRAWGSTQVAIGDDLLDLRDHPARVAAAAGEMLGYLVYRDLGGAREILALEAVHPGRGVGQALIEDAAEETRLPLVLTTTNDNLNALGFYQHLGFVITDVRPGAIDRARERKPTIPLLGDNGLPIRDEIVLTLPQSD